MRLSTIKLAGFKSFVDPTVLRLSSNLSGVVGPNGCGKSNVIDAVRWVMGESSARQLRGEALEDVIFNGSNARKPIGRAAIELLFDNGDGSLGGQYAGFSEISVKREIVRDSGSHYYLNGARCRRRDVVDLFLGTGLGSRSSYAIIEQGTVSRIIEARPEEMRLLLEEAAGISKYKEKRRETENRIRHTRENLDRLNDLRSELAAQLERLKRQSENAEKYKEYKKQERILKAEHLAARYRAMDGEASVHRVELEAASARQAQAGEILKALEQSVDEARRRQHRAGEEFQARQAAFYGAEAEVARIEQALGHAREMAAVRAREIDALEAQIRTVSERLTSERARHGALVKELATLDTSLATAEDADRDGREHLDEVEVTSAEKQAGWERFSLEAEAPLRQVEVERARVVELERRQRTTADRIERLDREAAGLDGAAAETELEGLDAELKALEGTRTAAEQVAAAAAAGLEQDRERRAALENELHGVREALQSVRGRVASLEALQAAALKRDDEALGDWLQRRGWAEHKRLAQCLSVEVGWEIAVEAALGHFLHAVCVDVPHTEAQDEGPWPQGDVALVGLEHSAPAAAARAGIATLASKVRGPVPWGAGPTMYAVDSDSDALALAGRLEAGEAAVSRNGLCAGPGWLHRPGRGEADTGVIARERALAQLHGEIADLAARNDALSSELESLGQSLRERDAMLAERRAELDRATRGMGTVGAKRQAQAVRLEQIRKREENLHNELAELSRVQGVEQAELGEARERLRASEEHAVQLGRERKELQEALQAARNEAQAARRVRDQARDRLQALQVQQASRRSALQAAAQGESDYADRVADLEHQLDAARAALEESSTPIAASEQARERALAARREAQTALDAARLQQSEADTEADTAVRRLREAEHELNDARDAVQTLRLSGESLQVRLQTVAEQVLEAGFRIEALLESLPENATPGAWEDKLASMDRRIQRLGAINLAAIDEYREQSARAEYLAAQDQDLRAALETLEDAIRKIDRETRARFRNTFDQVDAVFRQLFPKLFGGGEAYLEMAGEDLLEAGVRVMARPPGKRNSSIQLLSGGEKALAAVALVFSLFELNPAPFCMLDEVDAPLDDANVGRFCGLVKEMSARVQFIVITHNKVTMELADQLHGVTMQEPGVSRLVSVDVERALEMAAS